MSTVLDGATAEMKHVVFVSKIDAESIEAVQGR
jgi:hypothetical protein